MSDFKNNIIDKIKTGEIDMKPRWHFLLQSALFLVGTIIVAISAIYLLSFVFFSMHRSGVLFAPNFGYKGIGLFLASFPWFLVFLVTVFLVLLHVLVKRYSFSYQRPLLYSIIGAVVLVLLGSVFINQTAVHDRMMQFSEHRNVPGLSSFYRLEYGERPEGVVLGTITEVNENGFVLVTDKEERVEVVITAETTQKPRVDHSVGREVLVFGERVGRETIVAFGVRPAEGGMRRWNKLEQEGQVIRPMIERSKPHSETK